MVKMFDGVDSTMSTKELKETLKESDVNLDDLAKSHLR